MRHRLAGRKLGRTTTHRRAFMRNLATALIRHGRIRTTLPKAKELRGFAERLVSLGKIGSLHARRLAFDRLRDRHAVTKLFGVIAPAFASRPGGYTRILKLPEFRRGDGSELAVIEYLRESMPQPDDGKKAKKSKKQGSSKSTAEKARPPAPSKDAWQQERKPAAGGQPAKAHGKTGVFSAAKNIFRKKTPEG